MQEDLQNDDFEDLFKKKMNETDSFFTEDTWDVPSDRVWDNVEQTITTEAVSKTNLKTWGIGITVLVIIIALLYTCNPFQNKMESTVVLNSSKEHSAFSAETVKEDNVNSVLEDSKEPQPQKLDASGEAIAQANTPSIVNAKSDDLNSDESITLTKRSKGLKQETKQSESVDFTFNNTKNARSPKVTANEKLLLNENSGITLKDLSLIDTTAQKRIKIEDLDQQVLKEKQVKITTFPTLSKMLLSEVVYKRDTVYPSTSQEIKSAPMTKQGGVDGRFYLGAYYAPLVFDRKVEAINIRLQERLDRVETPDEVFTSAGLRLGYQLTPRLSIESGVQYLSAKSLAKYDIEINYDPGREILNANGNYESTYRVTLSTSLGAVATDVALTRNSSSTVPTNTSTFVEFEVGQKFKYLKIPVTLKYELGKGKIRGTLRSGIAAGFLLDHQLSITRTRTNQVGLQHSQTRVIEDFRGIKDKSLDLLFAVGVQYSLSPKVNILLEPNYQQSLTPLVERTLVKTYSRFYGVNLGLNYHF